MSRDPQGCYEVLVKYLDQGGELKELLTEEWSTVAADAIFAAAGAVRIRPDCKLVMSAVAERKPGKRRA